jgi:glycolate oxidase iron-sulfur subunit
VHPQDLKAEMQTNFTPKQLENPRLAEADRILRRCVHCGLCTATCSTYVLVGDERDSPRGRIYLMKDMFENDRDAGDEVRHHIDRCLSCLSCMTTCPSGVDYMHLVDLARTHIEDTGRRSFKDRLLRTLLANLIPYPDRFARALALAPLAQPFKGVLKRLGLKEVVAMLDMAPPKPVRGARFVGPGTAATKMERRKRVLLLAGCAQQVLRPEINDATIRLLARRGVDVEVAAGAGCCGALVHHMGKEAMAVAQAKRNVDAWWKANIRDPIDAIIINASGCGTTVKDYGHLLRHEPDYAERAATLGALARDLTEFLSDYELGPPKRWSTLRVAYHSACSMQHGQRIVEEPRALLAKAGFTVLSIPESHICCGSAGVYNILQPELAGELRVRKVANIESVRPDVVAAGNLGCITQIKLGTRIPMVHTVELLDWAYGGPVPRGLERFASFVTDVPAPEDAYIA